MTSLRDALEACVGHLPESFRSANARLFLPEHLDRLAARLLAFHRQGVPAGGPPPHFDAECTPPLQESFAFFAPALALWEGPGEAQAVACAFAAAMAEASCAHLLLLLGQRRTPASLTEARGIPPPRAVLLAAASRACGPTDPLTVAARALAKHAHRSPDRFWGVAGGSVADKNREAAARIDHILDRATWWNVFGHFAHETVFEARVPSGHGARWAQDGRQFIGFLEPFGARPDAGDAGA
jgi:hypothetical protein